MNFISGCRGIRKIEYDVETVEQAELTSTFINEKTYLPLLELLIEIKKQTYRHVMLQTNLEDFITLPPMIRLINRKITLVFDYFAYIGKNASQLFCTSDIENIDKAIEIYEHFSKKIPLEWPICTSADIMRTLSKLKVNLEKFKKYLLSTFYLLTKFYLGKGLEEKSMEPLLIKKHKKGPSKSK